jgi:hypothetical protein
MFLGGLALTATSLPDRFRTSDLFTAEDLAHPDRYFEAAARVPELHATRNTGTSSITSSPIAPSWSTIPVPLEVMPPSAVRCSE